MWLMAIAVLRSILKKVTTKTELRQRMKLWGEQEKQQSEQREQDLSSLISLMRQERQQREQREQREQRISSLIESMRQEREEEKQTLSLAVSRMERALSRLKATGCLLFT
jgi:hypothetical protein